MSIYIGNKKIKDLFAKGTTKSYSAMRGPCPVGYHIPLLTEWEGVKAIMNSLSLTKTDDYKINLHIPLAGIIYFEGWTMSKDYIAYFWSSTPNSTEGDKARTFYIGNGISTASYSRAGGLSIRAFKDLYTAPDSTWTVIKGTLGGSGIFRNQTDGLISITSDGTTGYTIQDKNLGATSVYNSGDALSEANCGNYYQWGNNYGFARTGSVTTSSTQVNTSGYGPGNYYSSSTFIPRKKDPRDWSSIQNDDLWGGVTGITYELAEAKAVYLGSTKVRESGPSLLTYEEIVAMATNEGQPRTNTIAELNSRAEEYYDSLTNAGKIVRSDSYGRELGDNSSRKWVNLVNGQLNKLSGDEGYAAVYNATQQQWHTQYVDGGPD